MTQAAEPAKVCQTCGFWQRHKRPNRREATEYQTWRPCGSNIRPGIQGDRAPNYTDTQLLTAPATTCRFWIAEGAVHY